MLPILVRKTVGMGNVGGQGERHNKARHHTAEAFCHFQRRPVSELVAVTAVVGGRVRESSSGGARIQSQLQRHGLTPGFWQCDSS